MLRTLKKLVPLLTIIGVFASQPTLGQNMAIDPAYAATPSGPLYNPSQPSQTTSQECKDDPSLWNVGFLKTDVVSIAVTKFNEEEIKKHIRGKDMKVWASFCEGEKCGAGELSKRGVLVHFEPPNTSGTRLDMQDFSCAGGKKGTPMFLRLQVTEAAPIYKILSETVVSTVDLPVDQFVRGRHWNVPLMYGEVAVDLDLIRRNQ